MVGQLITEPNSIQRGIVWAPGQPEQGTGTLGDRHLSTIPLAINESRQVVGLDLVERGGYQGFLWSETTGITNVTEPGGYVSGELVDINEAGQAVGSGTRLTTETPEGHVREGFLYTPGKGLETLANCPQCFPLSLNDGGSIAGWMIGPDYNHAFLLHSDGTLLDLGLVHLGGFYAGKVIVNNQDWVVWTKDLSPFLYVPGRGSMNLNDLVAPFGGRLASAVGINDQGYIAGTAEFGSVITGDLTYRPFLLTPIDTNIPEPATLTMILLSGAIVLIRTLIHGAPPGNGI